MATAKRGKPRPTRADKRRAPLKTRYGIGEAKTHLSEIVERVETTGESVVVTRHGRPVARLIPERAEGPRELGFAKGRVQFLPGWDEPLTYEDLFGK